MAKQRQISAVSSMKEKQQTYKTLTGRFDKAMKFEFYCEAILIDYAIIEDRLLSMLYHLGIRENRDSHKFDNKLLKPIYQKLIGKYLPKESSNNLTIDSITGKMKLVKAAVEWAKDGYPEADNDKYLSALWSVFQNDKMNPDDTTELFDEIDKWRSYRNEIIHSLMNKNHYADNSGQ